MSTIMKVKRDMKDEIDFINKLNSYTFTHKMNINLHI